MERPAIETDSRRVFVLGLSASCDLTARAALPAEAFDMRLTPEASQALTALRAEKKFVEEDFYPGAPIWVRGRCQKRVDALIDDVVRLLGQDASKEEVLARAEKTIASFAREDTEEREKAEDYIGEVMRTIGVDDWADLI